MNLPEKLSVFSPEKLVDLMTVAFQEKRYKLMHRGNYNLNIVGVRAENSKSNDFDDSIVVFYKENGKWTSKCYAATTDPGKPWLLSPMDPNGTLILVPGQYLSAFAVGIHGRTWKSGGYTALEQVRPMRYVRDNNKDAVLDFDLYRDRSQFSIHGFTSNPKSNIHRASKNVIARFVETNSAGCQVIQRPGDFDEFIDLCQMSATIYGNSFTYTLLEERDLDI